MKDYFSGNKLYGDDFDEKRIAQWLDMEKDGYYNLAQASDTPYSYGYHALNNHHFYRHLEGCFGTCVALGCARGDDISPISNRVKKFLAIEPATEWWSSSISGTPAKYHLPSPDGKIPVDRADLVICFGVLHHVPNVTAIISEFSRIIPSGGILLVREPICSMDDWRKPRPGLTRNERGLPRKWFEQTLQNFGFSIQRRAFCMFPLTGRIAKLLKRQPYNSPFLVKIDNLLSKATGLNDHYHRDTFWKKIAPSSIAYIIRKN